MTDQRFWQRLNQPPPAENADQEFWQRDVTDSLNSLPPMSTFSFTTPESTVTAQEGTIGVNLNPNAIALWFKEEGNGNTGWQRVGQYSSYAGVVMNDNTTAQSIGSPTTIDFDAGSSAQYMPFSDSTSDAATSLITIGSDGDYFISGSFSFRAAAGNSIWHTHVFVNGSETSVACHRKIGTANDVGNAAFTGILTLSEGDVLGSWCSRSDTDTAADVTFEEANFNVQRLG